MEEVEIPSYFLCPISLQLMWDPVTLPTGITYDRESIERWLLSGNHDTCPVTKQPLPTSDLTPNHTLRRIIQAWCIAIASSGVDRIPTPAPRLTAPTSPTSSRKPTPTAQPAASKSSGRSSPRATPTAAASSQILVRSNSSPPSSRAAAATRMTASNPPQAGEPAKRRSASSASFISPSSGFSDSSQQREASLTLSSQSCSDPATDLELMLPYC